MGLKRISTHSLLGDLGPSWTRNYWPPLFQNSTFEKDAEILARRKTGAIAIIHCLYAKVETDVFLFPYLMILAILWQGENEHVIN